MASGSCSFGRPLTPIPSPRRGEGGFCRSAGAKLSFAPLGEKVAAQRSDEGGSALASPTGARA